MGKTSPNVRPPPPTCLSPPCLGLTPMTTQDVDKKSLFFRKLEGPDRWEAWVWTAVGLVVSAAILWGISYLKFGELSVYTYGVGIPLTAMMAVPIILWGMIKSMLNPPIFRPSRSIGFLAVMITALAANTPLGPAPVSTTQWRSTHTYTLPFEGPWYTLAGGETLAQNYLATSPAMRFGYAFTKLGPSGTRLLTPTADPYDLASYACFGQPVLSPVDAKVGAIFGAEKDHVPGKAGQENLLGNHIILEVGPQEHLILAYLKHGSILVKPGDTVASGQPLAACGNSGASVYPHLQLYALKDGKKLVLSEGLPLEFTNFEILRPSPKERVPKGVPRGSGAQDDLVGGQTVQSFAF